MNKSALKYQDVAKCTPEQFQMIVKLAKLVGVPVYSKTAELDGELSSAIYQAIGVNSVGHLCGHGTEEANMTAEQFIIRMLGGFAPQVGDIVKVPTKTLYRIDRVVDGRVDVTTRVGKIVYRYENQPIALFSHATYVEARTFSTELEAAEKAALVLEIGDIVTVHCNGLIEFRVVSGPSAAGYYTVVEQVPAGGKEPIVQQRLRTQMTKITC